MHDTFCILHLSTLLLVMVPQVDRNENFKIIPPWYYFTEISSKAPKDYTKNLLGNFFVQGTWNEETKHFWNSVMNYLVPGIAGGRKQFWETNNLWQQPFLTKESVCVLQFCLLHFATSEAAEGKIALWSKNCYLAHNGRRHNQHPSCANCSNHNPRMQQ